MRGAPLKSTAMKLSAASQPSLALLWTRKSLFKLQKHSLFLRNITLLTICFWCLSCSSLEFTDFLILLLERLSFLAKLIEWASPLESQQWVVFSTSLLTPVRNEVPNQPVKSYSLGDSTSFFLKCCSSKNNREMCHWFIQLARLALVSSTNGEVVDFYGQSKKNLI